MATPTTRRRGPAGLLAALLTAAGALVVAAGPAMAAGPPHATPAEVPDCDPSGTVQLDPMTTVVVGGQVDVTWRAINVAPCNPAITLRMSGPGFNGDEAVDAAGSRQITVNRTGSAEWTLSASTRFGETELDRGAVSVVSPPPVVPGLDGGAVAFTGADSRLAIAEPDGVTVSGGPAVRSGTRASLAGVGGVFDAAYQGTDGHLWLVSPNGGAADTGLGMAAGTSPSIVATDSGHVTVAFQANTTELWTYSTLTGAHGLKVAMAPGTSPAATLTSAGVAIAFADPNDNLSVLDPVTGFGGFGSPHAPLAPGTGPVITYIPNQPDAYEIAYQDPDHNVRTADSAHAGTFPSPLTAAAGTSPAITTQPNGEIDLAANGTDGLVATWALGTTGVIGITGYLPGTSPSIAAAPGGGTVTAWHNALDTVSTFQPGVGITDTGLTEPATDSPTLAQFTSTIR